MLGPITSRGSALDQGWNELKAAGLDPLRMVVELPLSLFLPVFREQFMNLKASNQFYLFNSFEKYKGIGFCLNQ